MAYCKSKDIKVYPSGYRSAAIDIEASRTTEGSVRRQSNAPLARTSYAKMGSNNELIFSLDGYMAEIDSTGLGELEENLYPTPVKDDAIFAILHTKPISAIVDDEGSTKQMEMMVKDTDLSYDLDDGTYFHGISFERNEPTSGTYLRILAHDGSSWAIPKASRLNIASSQVSNNGNEEPISEAFNTETLDATTLSSSSLKTSTIEVTSTSEKGFNYSGIQSANKNSNQGKYVWVCANTNIKGQPAYAEGLTFNPKTNTLTTPNLTVSTKGGFIYTNIDSGTTDVARPIWFASADSSGTVTKGTPVVSDDFKYNPNTKVLTTGNIYLSSIEGSKNDETWNCNLPLWTCTRSGSPSASSVGSYSSSTPCYHGNSDLYYNPYTQTLTATNFSGSLKGSAVDSSSNQYASTVSTDNAAGSDYVFAVSKGTDSSKISVTRASFKTLKIGSGSASISYTPNEDKTITFKGSGATSVSTDTSTNTITITSTDTKNTAGATSTNETIYLIGVKQSGDPQETFIHSDVSLASTTSTGDTSYLKIGTANSAGRAQLSQTSLNLYNNSTQDECSLTPLSLNLLDYNSTSSRSLRLNVDTTNSQSDYFYIADNSRWVSNSITKSFKITSDLGLEFKYTKSSSTYTTLSFGSETGVFNLSGANSSNTITLAPTGSDSNFISGKFNGGQYKINYTTSGVFQLWNNTTNSFSVTAAGAVTAASYNATSDRRLKENISDYACSKSILDLPIKKFDFINGPKNQIGCIAQDLQEICPEIVSENSDGYLSIQESKIVYLLLDEVKRLRKEVDELKGGK